MKFEYDDTVDALFIWFVDVDTEENTYAGEIWPKELNNKIGLLFDNKGHLMGLEVLFASNYFDKELLEKSIYKE